jgi:hypothetical protein
MKTIIKQWALTALLLMGLYTVQAQALVFTTNGIITSGFDATGVFGTANVDLTGLSYTQSFTLDPAQYAVQITYSLQHRGEGALVAGTATETVTVNGLTQSYLLDLTQSNSGEVGFLNQLTQGLGGADQAYYNQVGVTTDGQSLMSYTSVYSYANPLNIGLSYTQIWSYSPQSGDVYDAVFRISGPEGTTQFWGAPSFISINAVPEPTSNAVPEPTGLMLFALGLIGLTGMHRKSLLKE